MDVNQNGNTNDNQNNDVVVEQKENVDQQVNNDQQQKEQDESLTINEILKDCKSFDDLFKHERVSQLIEERKQAEIDEVRANLQKRDDKINELMDELKPIRNKFKSPEHMKMFNDGDLEGFTKQIEEDTSATYKEIISTNTNTYTTEKEALTKEKDDLVASNEKLRDSLKDIKLDKFFSDKEIETSAIADAIKFAKEEFDIDDELQFKSKSNEDDTVEKWIDLQRTKRAYWFKQLDKTGVSKNNRSLNQNVSKDLADLSYAEYVKARERQENKKK